MSEKIQKVLSKLGLGSRRLIEKNIFLKKLYINGKIATIGMRIDKNEIDSIVLDGNCLNFKNYRYQSFRHPKILLYHKKIGEICTNLDTENRKTVFQNLPKLKYGRWISIGRLDLNTSGVLLFTSDGDLANVLMHPKSRIIREYKVRVFSNEDSTKKIDLLKRGIKLEDGIASFNTIKYCRGIGKNKWYQVSLMEGRNKEIRRMWQYVNCQVNKLIRIRFGNIFLPKHFSPGSWKMLNKSEIKLMLSTIS